MTLTEIDALEAADPFEDAYLAHRRSTWHRVSWQTPEGTLAPWRAVPLEVARHYPYVVLNNATHINFLAWDLDGGQVDAITRLEAWCDRTGIRGLYVPTPNGCHFIVAVDSVSRSHAKSVAYAMDLWRGIGSQLNADPSYSMHSVRNPLAHFTVWQGGPVYALGALRAVVAPVSILERVRRTKAAHGRNSALYAALSAMDSPSLEDGRRMNAGFTPPLPDHEVRSTVRSAQKRAARRGGHLLSTWGRKGGQKGSVAQGRARARNLEDVNASKVEISARRAAMARYLARQGLKASEIAQRLAVSVRTVYRLVHLCSLEPCRSSTPIRPNSAPTGSQHTRPVPPPPWPPGSVGTRKS